MSTLTKQEALQKIKELQDYINEVDSAGTKKEKAVAFLKEQLASVNKCKITEGYITYYKDDEWLFQQDLKNKYLWVSYRYIWSVLEGTFSSEFTDIQQLTQEVLLTPLNCEGFTTCLGSTL